MLASQSGQKIKPVLFILLLLPLVMLAYRFYSDGFGANPIETINRYTGDWALRILLFAITLERWEGSLRVKINAYNGTI